MNLEFDKTMKDSRTTECWFTLLAGLLVILCPTQSVLAQDMSFGLDETESAEVEADDSA